jgi:cell division protein ZapA
MANINVKFNNKDYLLSCDDGQEKSLLKLVSYLDSRHQQLKDKLGNIGENKLLLITAIQIIDDYFNLKKKLDPDSKKLEEISNKFLELKKLAIQFKEKKDIEINELQKKIDNLENKITENNQSFEVILDRTTDALTKFLDQSKNNEIQ